jgi:predicted acyltransferase
LEEKTKTGIRSYALDALRGFAILTMILSGRISWGNLPAWMYHAQVPPPDHKFNPMLPGITWVDLVFPFFLFAMGAAFPLALSKKVKDGKIPFDLILQIFKRGALLCFFAIAIQHLRPHVLSKNPDVITYLIALLGFALLFLIFWRFPASFSKNLGKGLRIAGWVGIVVLLALLTYPDDSGFKMSRFDIIIAVLANVSVAGSLIWLFTRESWIMRLGVMAVILAIRLSNNTDVGFIKDLASLQPSGWVINVNFLKYLFIVIPGTIVGDIIVRMMRTDVEEITASFAENKRSLFIVAIFMVGFIVLSLVNLYNRWVWEGFIGGIALCIATWVLLKDLKGGYYDILKELFIWGAFWFILGYIFEPFEGGIKKDHSTMSYYFLTSGLAIFFIIFSSIVIDFFKKKSYLGLLIDSGQNPMIAYAGGGNLLTPLLGLAFIESLINQYFTTPFLGALKGFIVTLILAYIVKLFTKYKIFWRS